MREEIGIIGATVTQGNLQLLERLTLPADERAPALPELKQALGVDELVYLATCNRVEFIYSGPNGQSASAVRNRLLDYFFEGGRQIRFSHGDLFALRGTDAIRHIFRVTASLESMVIGETQITGQIKTALGIALQTATAGLHLEKLITEALLIARKVRNETKIGSGSLSMASLVIGELQKGATFTKDSTIALIGAGEMTVKMAAYLSKLLPAQILFVNRTKEKAETLAARFSGRSVSLERFISDPGKIDAIISATSSPQAVFDQGFLDKLRDKNEHVICVDLAIPRDFAPDYDESEVITLIDIPRLNENKDKNLRGKFRELDKSSEIIETATLEFVSSFIEDTLKPALEQTREESLQFAREKCDRLFSERLIQFSSEERELVYDLMKKVLGRAHAKQSRAFAGHLSRLNETPAIDDVDKSVNTGKNGQNSIHLFRESVSEI